MENKRINTIFRKLSIFGLPPDCPESVAMPIHCPIAVKNLTQSEFDERDKIVLHCAYEVQNSLGRLCEEAAYETELARRLRALGFRNVYTQIPVSLTHDTYTKEYRLDILADNALYELKTVAASTPQHDAQVLHYSMLLAVNHGKLINFRNSRVEGRLRFNTILSEARYQVRIDDSFWKPLSPQCQVLMDRVTELLRNWGGFLDFRLYEAALVHCFGGEQDATVRSPLKYGSHAVGTHRFCVHAKEVCFMVSGFAKAEGQTSHVQRLLSLSQFKAMQWLNFHHHTVQFRTLTK
jgi:GxxExxY protein